MVAFWRTTLWNWLAVPLLLVGFSPAAHAEGKQLALLIGVDKYSDGSGFASLKYTEQDVAQLAEVLLGVGYRPEHVRLMTLKRGNEDSRFYPSLRNVRREIKLLAADCKPEDTLIVALSGHGITRRVGGKPVAFFAPIDVEITEPDSLLPLDELYATLEKSVARTKVLLVDACRNDPTEGRAAAIPFAPEPAPASIAALFACSDGEVAWDAAELGGGHGVFFHFVIEGLKGDADASAGNRDGKVSLAELLAYTQDKVPDYVSGRRGKRQMPILLGNTGRITLLDLSGSHPADVLTSKATGMKLKLIPAGSFLMGSSKDDDPDAFISEIPQHRVRITKSFYLGMTEITVGQFRSVVESANYVTEAERDGGGVGWDKDATRPSEWSSKYSWRNPGFAQGDDCPVTNVTWNDAIAYCNSLSKLEDLQPYYRFGQGEISGGEGYRLPTEAEWEYACRGGTTGKDIYCFIGDAVRLEQYAWYDANSNKRTHPVGQKTPNAWGLFDMHGNVWEWCWDWDSSYESGTSIDPVGPARGHLGRTYRGGSWFKNSKDARSACRYTDATNTRSFDLGFRVARGRSDLHPK